MLGKKIFRGKVETQCNSNIPSKVKDTYLKRLSLQLQGFFSGVSGAVIRPLSQWQMPTFFPNLNKKIPNQKVILCKSI